MTPPFVPDPDETVMYRQDGSPVSLAELREYNWRKWQIMQREYLSEEHDTQPITLEARAESGWRRWLRRFVW